MHVAWRGTGSRGEESRLARVTRKWCRSDLKRGETVGELGSERRTHLRHNSIQCSNRLDEKRIGAGRIIRHQDKVSLVVGRSANSGQDLREV
jgi:hypothetical protein